MGADKKLLAETQRAKQVLQLVGELRAAGIFTVAAVTRPFNFEGPRKIEAADRLIGSLKPCAHLVAVIEQASLNF